MRWTVLEIYPIGLSGEPHRITAGLKLPVVTDHAHRSMVVPRIDGPVIPHKMKVAEE